ncbi:MAG: RnfH family protein [Arsenophonus sp.]
MTKINIEIIYALPNMKFLFNIMIEKGFNVEEAIVESGILLICNDIDLTKNKVGIYSRPVKLSDILSDGDRVEIYRPLFSDPKEMRRKRAENAKQKP